MSNFTQGNKADERTVAERVFSKLQEVMFAYDGAAPVDYVFAGLAIGNGDAVFVSRFHANEIESADNFLEDWALRLANKLTQGKPNVTGFGLMQVSVGASGVYTSDNFLNICTNIVVPFDNEGTNDVHTFRGESGNHESFDEMANVANSTWRHLVKHGVAQVI